MKKVIFLGSKEIGFDCLQFLISNTKTFNICIEACFTQKNKLDKPEKDIFQLCKNSNIPTFEKLEQLKELPETDFLISVQYHQILKAKHLAKATKLAINLHMAPVPEYRGCNQFSFAIIDDAKEFGTTIHKMDTSVDGGAILFEKRFPIPQNCWVKDLYTLTYKHSVELFKANIKNVFEGNYTEKPQSSFSNRKVGFHTRNEINIIKQLDLTWSKEKIERHLRATYFPPFEPPYFVINNQKVFLVPEYPHLHLDNG